MWHAWRHDPLAFVRLKPTMQMLSWRMRKERPQPPEPFSFTEREQLYSRISHERLQALMEDEQTTIHKVELSANLYGEFVFLTVSRPEGDKPQLWTLFGLGYHEHRERWLTQEWSFFRANPFPETLDQRVSKAEAQELLRERQEEIAPYATQDTQTGRGKLFEMLADLTDDDGALAEMEDLGDLWDTLGDSLE